MSIMNNHNSDAVCLIYQGETLDNYQNYELKKINDSSPLHFNIKFSYKGIDREELINTALLSIENTHSPEMAAIFATTGFSLGETNEYVSKILSVDDVQNLNTGESIIVISPTGSGKSEAIERIILQVLARKRVVFLTNRTINVIQVLKDFRNKLGLDYIPDEVLTEACLNKNLEVMTYQKFIHCTKEYNDKELLLIMDECHSITEDSVFSLYGHKFLQYLHNNLDKTTRIYITATPDDVIYIIWKLESLSKKTLYGITKHTFLNHIAENRTQLKTRIKRIYMMKPNWDYIEFKTYLPRDTEKLQNYINEFIEKENKVFIFVNDKDKGKKLQEKFDSSQHVYSSEDKSEEITRIALESKFSSDTLIATKVAENGLSLHDDKLNLIVAETWDPVTLQQVIGRARVNRKKPRKIIVLIPDYSLSDLNTIEWQVRNQLKIFEDILDNPDVALEYQPNPNPYVYYSAIHKKPVVNELGYNMLKKQLTYLKDLTSEEKQTPHAFLRRVLSFYGKETAVTDEMYIDYDSRVEFNSRVKAALDTFKNTQRGEDDLSIFKESLKNICNETHVYGKELKTNIQISTVNEILKMAGINESLKPERKVFDVSINSDIEY